MTQETLGNRILVPENKTLGQRISDFFEDLSQQEYTDSGINRRDFLKKATLYTAAGVGSIVAIKKDATATTNISSTIIKILKSGSLYAGRILSKLFIPIFSYFNILDIIPLWLTI